MQKCASFIYALTFKDKGPDAKTPSKDKSVQSRKITKRASNSVRNKSKQTEQNENLIKDEKNTVKDDGQPETRTLRSEGPASAFDGAFGKKPDAASKQYVNDPNTPKPTYIEYTITIDGQRVQFWRVPNPPSEKYIAGHGLPKSCGGSGKRDNMHPQNSQYNSGHTWNGKSTYAYHRLQESVASDIIKKNPNSHVVYESKAFYTKPSDDIKYGASYINNASSKTDLFTRKEFLNDFFPNKNH